MVQGMGWLFVCYSYVFLQKRCDEMRIRYNGFFERKLRAIARWFERNGLESPMLARSLVSSSLSFSATCLIYIA